MTDSNTAEPELPRMIDIQVPHLKKQTRFFRDGSVDTWVEFIYEEETGPLTEKLLYEADGSLNTSFVFIYQDNRLIKRNELDQAGILKGYETYEYDTKDNMIKKTAYNAEDEPQITSAFNYDSEGNRIKLTIYDGNNGLLSHIDYTFENGNEVLSELYSADGKITNIFEKIFNAEGKLVKELDKTADGSIEGSVEYSYDNGALLLEEHRNRAGGLVRKYIYENDENGSPVKIILMNNKDITLEIQESDYFYTTEAVPAE